MDILEEIRKAINTFDPELSKNEDELENSGKNVTIDDYQDAIDGASDPEDLNFSMSNLFDTEDEDEEEAEVLSIPQKDYEEEPLKEGDHVKKLTRKDLSGTVLSIGELVEVEWNTDLITLEYPEELIHSDDPDEVEDEIEKLTSLETDPPKIIENPEK